MFKELALYKDYIKNVWKHKCIIDTSPKENINKIKFTI